MNITVTSRYKQRKDMTLGDFCDEEGVEIRVERVGSWHWFAYFEGFGILHAPNHIIPLEGRGTSALMAVTDLVENAQGRVLAYNLLPHAISVPALLTLSKQDRAAIAKAEEASE